MKIFPKKSGGVTRITATKPLPVPKKFGRMIADAGVWYFFFVVIYLILILKVISLKSLSNHLFFGSYSMIITTYILSRFILSYFKKPLPIDPTYKPSVTFVVPAKNEEDNIARTLKRFSEVNYPTEKIEVISINDGSTDNTYEEMLKAASELEKKVARVEVVNWQENRGKRHGMAEGIIRAKNEIIIFIDSDSFIEPDCVKNLVKYFSDPAVGAVSGHTDVYNRDINLLTQMQAIRYYIAFKVYKAAESVFGTVTCCPGCCSAYRKSYLMEFLDLWLNQTFLGERCTFGDDRSLTNFIIKKYRAVYAGEARAKTVVPETFTKYVRQQQRWKKSWIRETWIASGFMWKKNPLAAISFYSYVFLAFASPVVFFRAMIWHPIIFQTIPYIYLAGLFLMLLLHGLYYRVNVGQRQWFLAIINFWINTVILMWQLPWAIITVRDSRWGTR